MNEQADQTKRTLADFESSLAHSLAELEAVSRKLANLRERQKSQFGDLLIRTTLNEPLAVLLKRIADEEMGKEDGHSAN